ncbi:MAG: DUF6316 family protein [Pseudomonadales bacterium]
MKSVLPIWFQADQVFSHDGQWYFGACDSLHVGPYADRSTAEAKSAEVVDQLSSVASDGDRLRLVRKLLREEWDQVVLSSTTEEGSIEQVDVASPPMQVRQGEPLRNWFRSNRFFKSGEMWFFTTREGVDVGPFDSQAEAKEHHRRLLRQLVATRTAAEAQRLAYEYKFRPQEETYFG